MDHMGALFAEYYPLIPPQLNKGVPWNPLHYTSCFHLLLNQFGWPKSPLSGKTFAVVEFRPEIVTDVHLLIVADDSNFCKGAVLITECSSSQFNGALTHQALVYASWAFASLIIVLRV